MAEVCVTLQDIREAQRRIAPYVITTPMLRGAALDAYLGCEVYFKAETFQVSGSFKIRGAANKILALTPQQRERGLICGSSGNYGCACAMVCQALGVKLTVIMPDDAPQAKIKAVRDLGATLLLGPRMGPRREEMLQEQISRYGYVNIRPNDDDATIAGQGTCALEILEELPEADTLLVPTGDAGLLCGVAVAAKALRPGIRVVGIQASASDGYVQSFRARRPVEVTTFPSIADGLNCNRPGEATFPLVMKYVDDLVGVGEESIREGVRLLASQSKLIAEPSACVGLAAVLEGAYLPSPGERVVFLLTGSNWDLDGLGRILNGEAVGGFL